MPSPKLYFRCPPDLHARFIEHCISRDLSPSTALKLAVEQWLSPRPVTQPTPPEPVTHDPEWTAFHERDPEPLQDLDADLEALIAEFTEQGIELKRD